MAPPASIRIRLCDRTKLWSETEFINQKWYLGYKEKCLTLFCNLTMLCFSFTLSQKLHVSIVVSAYKWGSEAQRAKSTYLSTTTETAAESGVGLSDFKFYVCVFQLPKSYMSKNQQHCYWNNAPSGSPTPCSCIISSLQCLCSIIHRSMLLCKHTQKEGVSEKRERKLSKVKKTWRISGN